jgi:alpha-D-ribose 1-methylphosphonate 5-triphosphate diphosphatase
MALDVVGEINRLSPRLQVDHRIHARFDVLNQNAVPLLEKLVEGEQIHFLSVMDHTPGQGQFKDIEAYKMLNVHGYGVDPSAHDAMVENRTKARAGVDPARVSSLINFCRRHRIPLASHDDDSEEKIEWVKEMGIGISEFPVNMETARKAHEEEIFVAVGSPNVLRGSSWSNNLNARQLVTSGYGDILCSDYAPLTMLHAVFTLSRLGLRSLPASVNMVSLHPARAVGMETRIGSVEEGKRADLILVDAEDEVPRIVRTLVAGKCVYSMCRTYRGGIPS